MEKLDEIIASLGLENQLMLEEIPSIDLYMDQVIQLFENKFSELKRNDEDKILTKTMINNYAKGKLLFPIKNKKVFERAPYFNRANLSIKRGFVD